MSDSIKVRKANVDDLDNIVAGNRAMALETEDRELHPDILEQGVAHVLQNPQSGLYWIAECESRFVGQIMITREWSDWRNGEFWWIQSVYVAPAWRRRGVFRELYATVESAALQQQAVGLRLYVESDNEQARTTYVAMGMHEPAYRMMEVEFDRE